MPDRSRGEPAHQVAGDHEPRRHLLELGDRALEVPGRGPSLGQFVPSDQRFWVVGTENPAVADFVDCAVIGDGEQAVLEICDVVRAFKAEGSPGGRTELLLRLREELGIEPGRPLQELESAILAQDPVGRVACETLVTTGMAIIAGEITTSCYVDFPKIVRETIKEVGPDGSVTTTERPSHATGISVNSMRAARCCARGSC